MIALLFTILFVINGYTAWWLANKIDGPHSQPAQLAIAIYMCVLASAEQWGPNVGLNDDTIEMTFIWILLGAFFSIMFITCGLNVLKHWRRKSLEEDIQD